LNGDTVVIADARAVKLEASEGTIYYTVGDTPVTTTAGGNVPSPAAIIISSGQSVPITADRTRLNVAVIDAAGNAKHATGLVSPRAAAAPVAPSGVAVVGVTGSGPANNAGTIDVGWNAVPDATEYQVRVYDQLIGSTMTLLPRHNTVSSTTNATITGLPRSLPNHRYVVRVTAKTPNDLTVWGPLSTVSTATMAAVPGDTIGVVSARWRAGDELQIRGAGTNVGATITVHGLTPSGTAATLPLRGYPSATVGALEAPDNTGPWEIVVDPAPEVNPGELWIKSSQGHSVKITVETR
jgi:hypothetical protein